MGAGLRGRELVLPLREAEFAFLGRCRSPMRLIEKEPRKDDPEPKALSCYGLYLPELEEDLAQVRRWPSGELDHHAVSWVVLREAQARRQGGFASYLGQRMLAQEPGASETGSPPTTAESKAAAAMEYG